MDRKTISENILGEVKTQLGGRWDTFSEDDKRLIQVCCVDAAGLQLAALATNPNDEAAIARLQREKRHVSAQLSNVAAAVEVGLAAKFWNAVERIAARVLLAVAAI